MESSDLELATSQALVDELMRRKTFLGVIIQSRDELKADSWKRDQIFTVHHNSNLSSGQVHRLLDTIADYLDEDKGESSPASWLED